MKLLLAISLFSLTAISLLPSHGPMLYQTFRFNVDSTELYSVSVYSRAVVETLIWKAK